MSFGSLLADLDATAFAELSDDPSAIWQTSAIGPFIVAAMLDVGERVGMLETMPHITRADMIRLSAAELAAKAPGRKPEAGDTITVRGTVYVIHGTPRLDDEMNGRDWLCPVAN